MKSPVGGSVMAEHKLSLDMDLKSLNEAADRLWKDDPESKTRNQAAALYKATNAILYLIQLINDETNAVVSAEDKSCYTESYIDSRLEAARMYLKDSLK